MGRKTAAILGLCLASFALSGCATAIIGGITVGEISAAAGLASVSTTGKGLQDHALSAVTGQDCRLLEGIIRRNRRVCEEPGSPATENDFRGIVVMLRGEPEDVEDQPAPEVLYAGAADTAPLPLARIERQSGAITIEDLIADEPVQLAAPRVSTIRYPDAATLPTASDWASAQPAPRLITASWQSR